MPKRTFTQLHLRMRQHVSCGEQADNLHKNISQNKIYKMYSTTTITFTGLSLYVMPMQNSKNF